jgi:hypothetical protein
MINMTEGSQDSSEEIPGYVIKVWVIKEVKGFKQWKIRLLHQCL